MASDQDDSGGFAALNPVETDYDEDDLGDDSDDWLDLEDGESVVGELRKVREDCGEYGSRVYRISLGPGEEKLMWGNASVDRQIDQANVGRGDVIGIKNTGETYETERGEGTVYEVRTE